MRLPRWSVIVSFQFLLIGVTFASSGDRLSEFHECLAVCSQANCEQHSTPIPVHHRLLLWNCPAECDYTCQHIVTDARLARSEVVEAAVHQYHGKWPFYRFLGIQEPFSVLFSFMNYLAHVWGVSQLQEKVSPTYRLRKYYLTFGYFGYAAWVASMIFHTRDFNITEKTDYFAAGANVLYGLFFAPIRVFRLDDPKGNQPWKHSVVRIWTGLCIVLYILHVGYLTLWSWDYTYNMGANITVGVVQNILWTGFAWTRYMRSGRWWQAWPGMIVAWIVLAMSLEILDFVPWRLMVDAHSLWHLGTVGPTLWWYNFLVKDAQQDADKARTKA